MLQYPLIGTTLRPAIPPNGEAKSSWAQFGGNRGAQTVQADAPGSQLAAPEGPSPSRMSLQTEGGDFLLAALGPLWGAQHHFLLGTLGHPKHLG